ncbi:MAG: tRNA (N(6)-L-threonylcarbamoyladenosine(37)-C(2))-methylthiotransferase MtaB [Candidatus Aminicenantaceae bacterium]
MISFSIHNFGCRVNQAESFLWADELQREGAVLEEDFSKSDVVIINSCTLTHRSDRDVRKFINKVFRTNPEARMIVTGCLVERVYDEFESMPQIWRIFRNSEKNDLAEEVLSLNFPREKTSPRVKPFRSRALIKIQDGCDFRCSFCIIPCVRGKSISFPQEEVLSWAQKFINMGFKEIVLTGIHICSYGRDLKPKGSLLELLQEMEELKQLNKIRLSSLDPRFLNEPLAEHITSSRKICSHFHLSLQHASDRVLSQMERRITTADYQMILTYLRQRSPQASLGADIIVGFPEESEKDFNHAYEFLKHSPLTYFHVFSFSPRPGTPASSWTQVDEKVKKERGSLLRKLSRQKNLDFRRSFMGKELDGIVIDKHSDRSEVLTSNYIKVSVPLCPHGEREEARVKIKKVTSDETLGEIMHRPDRN